MFLGLAEELKLKGLTGSSSQHNTEGLKTKAPEQEKVTERRNQPEGRTPNVSTNLLSEYYHKTKAESSSTALVSVEELDEQIKSMMTRTEKKMTIRTLGCLLSQRPVDRVLSGPQCPDWPVSNPPHRKVWQTGAPGWEATPSYGGSFSS